MMADMNNEPIRLVCAVSSVYGGIIGSRPWTGGTLEGQLYRCVNLDGGDVESENPVPLVAMSLLNDGAEPTSNFSLETYPAGETLFIGLIGLHARKSAGVGNG